MKKILYRTGIPYLVIGLLLLPEIMFSQCYESEYDGCDLNKKEIRRLISKGDELIERGSTGVAFCYYKDATTRMLLIFIRRTVIGNQ